MSETEKCMWCGETERDPKWPGLFTCGSNPERPGMFKCGSDPAYGQSLDCALQQVEQLEARLSAAMGIIRRPDMLMFVDEGARPADGYWVRIEADWQFAGAELMDAITLLAGVEK